VKEYKTTDFFIDN